MSEGKTYMVRRFYADDKHPDNRKVIKRGLTLEEAQAHCREGHTEGRDRKGKVEWFDGYEEES